MDFWRFSAEGVDPAARLLGVYDLRLVLLSFAVAVAAAFASLEIVGRVDAAPRGPARGAWLAIGSVCMGLGVWAMHFVGMLSLDLPVPTGYDPGLTVSSIVPVMVASAVMIHTLAGGRVGAQAVNRAGIAMALGIGAMHYTGMEAMRLPGALRYDPSLFLLSFGVAYVLATTAFWAESEVRRRDGAHGRLAALFAAVILGVAVCGMHYTAMAATRIYLDPSVQVASRPLVSPVALGVAILVITCSVAAVVVAVTVIDRRLQRALTEIERLRRLLPICAWCKRIADPDGSWHELEAYLASKGPARTTHGICPTCSVRSLDDVAARA